MSDCTAYRNITYRLIPGSESKARKLAGQAGACRFVPDNHHKPSISFFSLGVEFTRLRKEIAWLDEYSYAITRSVLKYQSDAWKACFQSGRGFPKFKSKHGSDPSFTIPEDIRIQDGKLYIPKIGWLRIQRKGGNPYPEGKPVKAAVKREAGKWYAVVCYEVEFSFNDNPNTAGVDRNVGQVAVVDSNGSEAIHRMPDLARKEARRKRYQRKLARQVKGSKRRYRTKLKLQKCFRHLKKPGTTGSIRSAARLPTMQDWWCWKT